MLKAIEDGLKSMEQKRGIPLEMAFAKLKDVINKYKHK